MPTRGVTRVHGPFLIPLSSLDVFSRRNLPRERSNFDLQPKPFHKRLRRRGRADKRVPFTARAPLSDSERARLRPPKYTRAREHTESLTIKRGRENAVRIRPAPAGARKDSACKTAPAGAREDSACMTAPVGAREDSACMTAPVGARKDSAYMTAPACLPEDSDYTCSPVVM